MSMKPRFNPEVNLGHLIQLLAGFAMLVGMYWKFDARTSRIEERTAENKIRIVEHDRTLEVLGQAVVKLTTIQEERSRGRN